MPSNTKGLVLPEEDRAELSRRVSAATTSQRDALRARIILEIGEGETITGCARVAGCSPNTVRKWAGRYDSSGLDGLLDLPRSGAPPMHGNDARLALVALATALPPEPFSAWTHVLLAEYLGQAGFVVSDSWVDRALADAELDVTHTQGWLNRKGDPAEFAARAKDVCDLLVGGPGDGGVIVCIDEKTGIQALERTAPDVPSSPRHPRKTEFEYKRHSITNLMCAYRHDTGEVMWTHIASNNSATYCWFLGQVSRWIGGGKQIHLIADNGSSHISAATTAWLTEHPRFQTHYTPKHASWLNPTELIFSSLTRAVIKGRSSTSVADLQGAIDKWLGEVRVAKPIDWRYEWPG